MQLGGRSNVSALIEDVKAMLVMDDLARRLQMSHWYSRIRIELAFSDDSCGDTNKLLIGHSFASDNDRRVENRNVLESLQGSGVVCNPRLQFDFVV